MAKNLTRRTPCIHVSSNEAGQKLIDLLVSRFTYLTRTEWAEYIQKELVRLNQNTTHPDVWLKVGDFLEFHFNNIPEPHVNTSFYIIYEDDFFLAVSKPGNLPCHPGGRYFSNTLWALLKSAHGLDHVGFVNRIDRETSGIVLIAKDPETARLCSRQFVSRQVRKNYLAVVEGAFPENPLAATGYLAKDATSIIRKKQRYFREIASGMDAKFCRTDFKKVRDMNDTSLVEAVPHTGRGHQIRATLNALGYPIVGDKLYGLDETMFIRFIEGRLRPADRQRLRMPRQALHAAGLQFTHPRTGSPLDLHAPLPEDMTRLTEA